VGVGIAALVARRRGRWRDLAFVSTAAAAELICFLAISMPIHRDRPPVEPLDEAPFTGAYPSGHAAIAVVLYGSLVLLTVAAPVSAALKRAAVVAAGLGVVAVCAARLLRGHHRPTEIAAGLALGAAILITMRFHARRDGWSPEVPA
jgi:undecaprenyl-diphosphatase